MNALTTDFHTATVLPAGFVDARLHTPSLDIRHVVAGLLNRREVSITFGPSNTGKTSFAVALGASLVSERDFAGHDVMGGFVVHVAAESAEGVLNRARATFDQSGAAPSHPYLVPDLRVDLGDPEAVARLIAQVEEIAEAAGAGPALVIFDTLTLSIGRRDENNSAEMTEAIEGAKRIARDLDTHVMLIHHTGKDVSKGSRGTSQFRNNVDTMLALVPFESGDGVEVVHDKQREGRKTGPLAFRIVGHELGRNALGQPCTAAVAEMLTPGQGQAGTPSPRHARLTPRQAAVLGILKALTAEGAHIDQPVATGRITAMLPAPLLGQGKPESQRKAVLRDLEALAERAVPLVARRDTGWLPA